MKLTTLFAATLVASTFAFVLPACDDKGKDSGDSKGEAGAEDEGGPLFDKKISELTKEDLGQGVEKLGYELKSKSTSGEIITVLGKKGDERLVVTHKPFEGNTSQVDYVNKNGDAGAVVDETVIIVKLEPQDQTKAKKFLARFTGK